MSPDTTDTDDDRDPESTARSSWPVSLAGVTETIVTTRGPNELWNVAALGLFAGDPVTARTWGRTRTRGNFHREGEGYVQFTRDPVEFATAALSIYELDDPILDSADAWVHVRVDRIDAGTDGDTEWEQWAIEPLEPTVDTECVPTIDRGFGAVIEATVAASRLDVAEYDEDELRDRLEYCAAIVDRAGSPRECEALEVVREHSSW